MSYTVALIGWQAAGDADVQAALARFRRHVDGELGAKLPQTYRSWLNARSQTHDIRPEQWPAEARAAIEKWERAYEKACAQALAGLPGKGSEPWVDVQLMDGP